MARTTFGTQQTQESVVETYDPNKSRTEVRQASPRKMNLRVLITSLCGIIILFAVIYLVYTLTQSNPN
jgi:Fe2+ transport system protein B